MRKYILKLVSIIAIVGACLYLVYPPQEKIRLGKDLRGGVSLIYRVTIDDNDSDPQGTLKQAIEVLKDRVDPKGILDIAMQPIGRDRIEVLMPLPGPKVRALRDAYESALAALMQDAQIIAGDLQAALEAGNVVSRFGGSDPARMALMEGLQTAYDARQAAAEAYEQAQAAGADQQEQARLAQAVADADIDLDHRRSQVLGLSLHRARVDRALRLSTEPVELRDALGEKVVDAQTGQVQMGPSPREGELASIAAEFPYLDAELDQLVTAYDAYAAERKGFDDPEDLMRLLRGAGVLDFRVAVRASDTDSGVNAAEMRAELIDPAGVPSSPVAAWFPINDLKQWYRQPSELAALQADPVGFFARPGLDLVAAERDGEYYLLLYTTDARSMTHHDREWGVAGTYNAVDNFGRSAVGVHLDASGGGEMNRLTGPAVGEPMAIVLDGEVYSAPRIQEALNRNFQITGAFSPQELSYLHRVLNAGSLQARLSKDPIAINNLGPSIGADNLRRGITAFKWALVAVAVFMLLYYFAAGAVADLALLINGIMIFGIMAGIDGTFTLPGLAGIVLTIGMAVDANVLIYERIREELVGGEVDLRGAIRLGYGKALSTIVDGNVTNLIVCAVLYQTATTEVKGFALTLSLGICATLFTALFVTRVLYDIYTDVLHGRRLPMLPTVFPALHRALEPSINWMGLRRYFITASGIAVVASIILVGSRGVELFDTEFRGGVAVTLLTRPIEPGATGDHVPRLELPHIGPDGVETRIHALGALLEPGGSAEGRQRLIAALEGAGVIDSDQTLPPVEQWSSDPKLGKIVAILDAFDKASVLTVGDVETRDGRVYAPRYQVKVASPAGLDEEATTTDVVVAAIVSAFGDDLDVTRPLAFDGAGTDAYAAHTYPIAGSRPSLGQNIERPRYAQDVSRFAGGVAVVLDDVQPPATPADVERRIARMRAQPDFERYTGREVEVFGLEPADPRDPAKGYTSLAVAVVDPALNESNVDDDQRLELLDKLEWRLVSSALQRQTSLEQVSSFSSAVARTLADNAVVAVGLSLLGILVYIWVRFGSLRYSAAAIVALIHDVTISLGLIALTAWFGVGPIASTLLLEEFHIDLGVVAALLTIIGYSLNDTIVILDRIRENRGKLPIPTPEIVNKSINQTISRTVLTSFTTLLAVAVMYAAGGSGIRPFAYCLLAGLVVGTYSSIAIAAPLVVSNKGAKAASPPSTLARAEADQTVGKEAAHASV